MVFKISLMFGKYYSLRYLFEHSATTIFMNVLQVQRTIEDEIVRKRTAIAEELTIDQYKVRFLKQAKFAQKMQLTFPGASIEYKDRKVVIKGLLGEVTNIKVHVQ